MTDDLFLVFVLFHHHGGGLSLPVKINERKQLEKKDGQTTCLKRLSSIRYIQLKDYQVIITKADNGSLKLSCALLVIFFKKRKLTAAIKHKIMVKKKYTI